MGSSAGTAQSNSQTISKIKSFLKHTSWTLHTYSQDLVQISDRSILNASYSIEFKAGLYLLKHNIFDKDTDHVRATLNLVKDLDTDRMVFIVDYIIHLPRYDEKEIEQILEETLEGEKVTPLADKWI